MRFEKTESGRTVLRINWQALIVVLSALCGAGVYMGQAVYSVGGQVASFQQKQGEMQVQLSKLETTVKETAQAQDVSDGRQDDKISANSARIRQVEISTASTATSVAQIASDMKDIKSLLYEALRKGDMRR